MYIDLDLSRGFFLLLIRVLLIGADYARRCLLNVNGRNKITAEKPLSATEHSL